MFLGSFLWITLIISITLLFILEYKLVKHLDKNIPLILKQLKEIKQLKENLLTKYK
ncbi:MULTISPECIES: hypothetical protein [Clostridium]|jgi:hypothetical protein|uniref:hypothetical protein n=1 Tax=Clostridium TaxID=1485 RepID=UPI0029153343|nr:hypothetical protein [Clostridium sp.]MDU7362744.1 hypothetical protein [Clostridium sp.]